MKLKVLNIGDTPADAVRRVVISLEDASCNEWIRDTMDNAFLLFSNVRGYRGDTYWDRNRKRRVEYDGPLEEILDEEGFGTGEHKVRDGVLYFAVDMYEHGGTAWALHGEGGVCFSCPWDTSRSAFLLWTDEDRWNRLGGNAKWEWKDGKPSDELYACARELARQEIKLMNLCERGSYYSWEEQEKLVDKAVTTRRFADGHVETFEHEDVDWDYGDSCGGYLTEKPAEECDFPLGVPVVTDVDYVAGDTFEQECWALRDRDTGKYMKADYGNGHVPQHGFFDDPASASLMCRQFLENNLKKYEEDAKRSLEIVDVTEQVWSRWPECIA